MFTKNLNLIISLLSLLRLIVRMNIRKLTKNFGVEITNFDCSKVVKSDDLKILKETIQENHFICFKNQKLNGDSLGSFN